MDNKLEKPRRFEASVVDFECYINDRIKQTKKENSKEIKESVFYEKFKIKPVNMKSFVKTYFPLYRDELVDIIDEQINKFGL